MFNVSHPAITLVLLVGLTIITVVPLVAWITLGEGRDKKANLWFLGMFFYVINAGLFTMQFVLPAWLAFGVANTGSVMMMMLMTESLRREISSTKPNWEWLALFVGAWFCIYLLLIHEGYRGTWGVLFMGITMVTMQVRIIYLLIQVKTLYKSRSCLILILAFSMAIVTNLTRGASGLFPNMFIDLLGLSAVSNLFFINILVANILINFGYWGFVLEKIQIAKNIEAEKAREQELKSTAFREYSEELQELVKQRDQMLMLVSKFASATSMAVFNTAIIHELSQPIQSLSLCLEGLKINIDQNQWSEANTQIDNAHQLTQKMGATLHSLRSLIQTNKPDLETLQMSKTLGQLIPIVQSECKRNDIEFIVTQSNEDVFINANKVLLERIIMNLVANSIEAFQSMEHPSPKKYIKVNSVLNTNSVKPCWQLTVEDNASGFSDEALKSITDPFVTTKITGLGIGLSFASLIVRLWQGQLHANNRSEFEGGGAIITIEIPQNLQAEPA